MFINYLIQCVSPLIQILKTIQSPNNYQTSKLPTLPPELYIYRPTFNKVLLVTIAIFPSFYLNCADIHSQQACSHKKTFLSSPGITIKLLHSLSSSRQVVFKSYTHTQQYIVQFPSFHEHNTTHCTWYPHS